MIFTKVSDTQYSIGDLQFYAHLVKDSKGIWGLYIEKGNILFLAKELEEILIKINELNR